MFLPYFIAILLGLASPSTPNNNTNDNDISTYDAGADTPPDDSGGETGHVPIKK